MIQPKFSQIQKRDGRLVDFNQEKITAAIAKALTATNQGDGRKAQRLSDKVVELLNRRFKKGEIPKVEEIQDIVEEVLILEGYTETAKAYILYREQRRRIREATTAIDESVEMVNKYLQELDWQVKENANMAYSLQGLNHYVTSIVTKKYWLNKVYPQEIREAATDGDFHIHNLDVLATYCCGWDLYDLLIKGFGGVFGKVESKPPHHFRTALGQLVNFFYTLQGESAGAQAVSSFDTLLAPFIRYDNLNYAQVKQCLQEFVFNCAIPTRVGFQTPFTNVTLDIKPSPVFAKQPVIIGGQPQKETYEEFQHEMDMFNRAFFEVMMEGDAKGRVFSVDGDSLCLIKNSGKIKLTKIGEYIDRLINKGKPIFLKENKAEVLDVRRLNIKCLGLKHGRVDWQKVNFVVRHPTEKLLKISTVGGFNITVTPSHSVLVLREGEIQSFKASELKIGDYLISPKIIPNQKSQSFHISLAEEFVKQGKTKGIYIRDVYKDGQIYQLEREIIHKRNYGQKKYKYSQKSSVLPLEKIASEINNLDLSQACISLAGSRIRIPNLLLITPQLIEFLGWYCAEGSAEKSLYYGGISLSLNLKKEKEKALKIASLIKDVFGDIPIKIREIEARNLIEVRVHSKLVRRIITEVFEIGNREKRKVPNLIFNLPEEYKRVFLRAYFDGDAWLRKERITVNSVSRDLIYGVSTLLKQLQIFHVLNEYSFQGRKRWRIDIWQGKELLPKDSSTISKIPIKESGLEEVLFKILEKEPYYYDSLSRRYKNTFGRVKQKLGIYRQQSVSYKIFKKILEKAEKLKISIPSALQEIKEKNLSFLKIKDIDEIREKRMVYDFSTESENFIANQLLVHNTFPIPTINITADFDWDNPALETMWEATAKYGINYFANFINSDMNPEDVRSMCLAPEEEMLVRNSRKVKRISIGELAEKYRKTDFDKEGWAECDLSKNLEVLSLNPLTGQTEWARVIRFLRIKDKKLVTIKTEDGKEIKVSSRHIVPVVTESGLVNKMAQEIKEGDYLLSLKQAHSAFVDRTYQKIDNLVLNEDLAKILGYFVADGNYLFESRQNIKTFGQPRGIQFTFNAQTKENFQEIKKLVSRVFGVQTKERKDPRYNSYYLYIYKADLARKLYQAGFRKYGRLPNILFNSPLSVIKSFLEYHFKGDGYLKRKEIHINDKELARDLVLLYSIIGQPVTYRERKNSQVIYLQHKTSKIRKDGFLNVPLLSERIPGFFVSSRLVPGLSASRMVGFDTLDKYQAHNELTLKLKKSDCYIIRVKAVKHQCLSRSQDFFDIELEKNHLFIHSLGTITHNCCRLRLSNDELYKRGGGLFGSYPKTGSIGVVTLNLPRIGYLSKTKREFFKRLAYLMDLAKESLEIKRKALENFMEKGLYPYSRFYLSSVKTMRGHYYSNHFSTIGLVGLNEALLNFIGKDIGSPAGRRFAGEVLDFMRERLVKYQEETGNLYNLEATPAEGTSYRLARLDREKYPDIITAGEKEPYYTNSSQLPVDYTADLFKALKLQDDLQTKYTGGTVFHIFLGERIYDCEMIKYLIKKIFTRFNLPYITFSPTFSICPHHGYLPGEHFYCPKCVVRQPCEVYSRIVGYLRPVQQWHKGKQEEFRQRRTFHLPTKSK